MKIGIDIDGVLTNFVDTFIELVKERFGSRFAVEDIRDHDLYKVLGIDKKEAFQLVVETLNRPLEPQKGAIEAVRGLSQSHEIYFITARPNGTEAVTGEWLRSHGLPTERLVFRKEGNKHEHEVNLDVIIDDNIEEVVGWIGKATMIIIFDHPWNKSLNIRNHFIRAYGWRDVLELLAKHTTSSNQT